MCDTENKKNLILAWIEQLDDLSKKSGVDGCDLRRCILSYYRQSMQPLELLTIIKNKTKPNINNNDTLSNQFGQLIFLVKFWILDYWRRDFQNNDIFFNEFQAWIDSLDMRKQQFWERAVFVFRNAIKRVQKTTIDPSEMTKHNQISDDIPCYYAAVFAFFLILFFNCDFAYIK